ncbi:MAG: hypothetical protein LBO09_01205 [Candidatus Peribacteria bacterium]|jgi:hypothetical protein|nr:hypothetical protein [Candidatus Peribacteria bacterium]
MEVVLQNWQLVQVVLVAIAIIIAVMLVFVLKKKQTTQEEISGGAEISKNVLSETLKSVTEKLEKELEETKIQFEEKVQENAQRCAVIAEKWLNKDIIFDTVHQKIIFDGAILNSFEDEEKDDVYYSIRFPHQGEYGIPTYIPAKITKVSQEIDRDSFRDMKHCIPNLRDNINFWEGQFYSWGYFLKNHIKIEISADPEKEYEFEIINIDASSVMECKNDLLGIMFLRKSALMTGSYRGIEKVKDVNKVLYSIDTIETWSL